MDDLSYISRRREDIAGNKPEFFLDGMTSTGEYLQYFLSVNTIDSSLNLETFYATDGLLMWGEEE